MGVGGTPVWTVTLGSRLLHLEAPLTQGAWNPLLNSLYSAFRLGRRENREGHVEVYRCLCINLLLIPQPMLSHTATSQAKEAGKCSVTCAQEEEETTYEHWPRLCHNGTLSITLLILRENVFSPRILYKAILQI